MEQPTANNQDTFIERVRLQRYKSIEDVEVTLKPELNIMIGANGSGKTNFVKGLYMAMIKKFDDAVGRVQVELNYRVNKDIYVHFYDYKYGARSSPSSKTLITSRIVLNDEEISKLNRENLWGLLPDKEDVYDSKTDEKLQIWSDIEENHFNHPLLISYGVSEDFNHIGNIENVVIYDESDNMIHIDGYSLFIQPHTTQGIFSLFENMITQADDIERNRLIFPANFVENLSLYTPVKDIRLEQNYRVENTKTGKELLHVRFEYFVDGKWRPWTHLSDGTKRLVYIITEVTFSNKIILLEEPELGIHPHQLSKLMERNTHGWNVNFVPIIKGLSGGQLENARKLKKRNEGEIVSNRLGYVVCMRDLDALPSDAGKIRLKQE